MITEATGLRFAHPDFDHETVSGLTVSPTGALQLASGPELLRQALLMLLSTTPGERVMRPRYGCDLLSLAFSHNDETTAGLAVHYVREAIERFEPRARIVRLAATRPTDAPHQLHIVLEYQPALGGAGHQIEVALPLDGPKE